MFRCEECVIGGRGFPMHENGIRWDIYYFIKNSFVSLKRLFFFREGFFFIQIYCRYFFSDLLVDFGILIN